MKLLRIFPGLVLNLDDVREISERDCGIYVTFLSGSVKFYPDVSIDDIWRSAHAWCRINSNLEGDLLS